MEQDLARHIVRSVFRAKRELEDLIGLLKANIEAEEHKMYAPGIATAIDGINVQVLR